ncbi:MAG: hypothetical protein GC164_04380 [Phycisphaera sp.]|nr:hypothetical protein [Phycisphaera sp.]
MTDHADRPGTDLLAGVVCVVIYFLLITGCVTGPEYRERPAQTPTVTELIGRHNLAVNGLDRVWARASLEIKWKEKVKRYRKKDATRTRFETGEGQLIVMLPDKVALTIGKLGKTLFWVGCDSERYWLFDLTDSDHKVAYVGRLSRMASADFDSPFPLHPSDVPALLDMVKLALTPEPATGQTLKWAFGAWVIEQPGFSRTVYLDHDTARARRVEVKDTTGRITAVSELSDWEIPADGGNETAPGFPGTRPLTLATDIRVELPLRQTRIALALKNLTTSELKFNVRQFDFEKLCAALEVDEVVDMDIVTPAP